MLTEWVCKLRGIDKWPSTSATVTAVEQVGEGGRAGLSRNVFFRYQPPNAEIQSGKLCVDDNSSVYNVGVAETFYIQFNPAHPGRFYCAEAISLSRFFLLGIMIVSFGLGFGILIVTMFVH